MKMAFGKLDGVDEETVRKLIHHSDRGVQYASRDYVTLLNGKQINISMTENGDPKENAMAERINSTVKNELLRGVRFTSIQQVTDAMKTAVRFYNTMRPHMSVDMMTPQEAAKCNGEIRKWRKSYREEAIKNARYEENH